MVQHAPEPSGGQVGYTQLAGWDDADHEAAFRTFVLSARLVNLSAGRPASESAKAWFERCFQPRELGQSGHVTAYYEPVLPASLVRTKRFKQAIYRVPAGMLRKCSRADIDAGALAGKGLEIAWVEWPVDAFLMQVQGRGRLVMANGDILRAGYAQGNGQAYRSVGQEMVRRGLIAAGAVTAQKIRAFVIANPQAGRLLLQTNQSFVYFKTIRGLAPDAGPLGHLGIPVSPLLSAAVDPAWTPLGLPLWIETEGPALKLRGVVIAQDIGGAIKGPGRVDLYLGSGSKAGELAGLVDQPGRVVVLWPKAGH